VARFPAKFGIQSCVKRSVIYNNVGNRFAGEMAKGKQKSWQTKRSAKRKREIPGGRFRRQGPKTIPLAATRVTVNQVRKWRKRGGL